MTDTDQQNEREHFFGAAKVVAATTILSRVLGLVRDIAINSLGAYRTTSAFRLAFQIPNLFRRLFGEGALSAAFVPVFSESLEDSDDRARALLGNALALLTAFLSALLVLVAMGLTCWALLTDRSDHQLLSTLTLIMLPFTLTVCTLALVSAALNCRGHFFFPAFAPVLLNIAIILAAWGVAPAISDEVVPRLYVIAAAVPIAGVIQLIGALSMLRRMGLRCRLRLRPVLGGSRRVVRLAGPMLIGLGFLQLSELLYSALAYALAATDTHPTLQLGPWSIAKPLQEGALVRIDAARRLYQFPMGVLAISLGVAVFPLLSRYASRGDMPNLRSSFNRALRLALMEGLAAGAGLFLLAEPITRLLFEHGRFTAADAASSAHVLRFYAVGVWAICTYQISARGFYALQDTITPLKVACGVMLVGLAAVLGTMWIPAIAAGAFGVGTVVSAALNTVLLVWLLRRRLGRLGGRQLALSATRSLVATAVMAGVLLAVRHALAGQSPGIIVAAAVPAGAVAFLLAARLLGMPELGELLQGALKHEDKPTE
ncbi:MAG: murein biosynthesis integral membrane protein MurJ [Phycisphaerae bacterium]